MNKNFRIKRSIVVERRQEAVLCLNSALTSKPSTFEAEHNRFTPSLLPHDTLGNNYRGGYVDFSSEEELRHFLQEEGRVNGWFHAVAQDGKCTTLRALIKALHRPGRSMGSPLTILGLSGIAQKHSSPGSLESYLRATIWQANRFLLGFGLCFSRRDYRQLAFACKLDIWHLKKECRQEWSRSPYGSGNEVSDISDRYNMKWSTGRVSRDPVKAGKRLAGLIVQKHTGLNGLGIVEGRINHDGSYVVEVDPNEVFTKAVGFAKVRELDCPLKLKWAAHRVNEGEFENLGAAIKKMGRVKYVEIDGKRFLVDLKSGQVARDGELLHYTYSSDRDLRWPEHFIGVGLSSWSNWVS